MDTRARTHAGMGAFAKAVALSPHKPPPQYAVVSEGELNQWHKQIEDAGESPSLAERQQKLQASRNRVAMWPNTLEALREKKEKARLQRMEDDESRRRLIDEEEAQYQKAVKDLTISKANQKVYESTERSRQFHSKLLLASVLEERDAQLQHKDTVKQVRRSMEMEYAEQKKAELAAAQEAERQAKEEQQRKLFDVKQDQLAQLRAQIEQRRQARDKRMHEGKGLMEDARACVAEEKAQRIRERTAAVETSRFRKDQSEHRKLAASLVEQDMSAMAQEIERFDEMKREQAEQRQYREYHRRHKNDGRRMDVAQSLDLSLVRNNEQKESLYEKYTQDSGSMTARMARDLDVRRQRQQALKEECLTARDHQVSVNQSRHNHLLETKKRNAQIVQRNVDALAEEDREEAAQRRRNNEFTKEFLALQVRQKQLRSGAERHQHIQEGYALQQALAEEDDMFRTYVSRVLGEEPNRRLVDVMASNTKA